MRILITGAAGYIGQGLTQALLAGQLEGQPLTQLVLNDLDLSDVQADDPRVRRVPGSLNDAAVIDALLKEPLDCVFHLAGITSRRAEEDLALGLEVNVQATMALLEGLRSQAPSAGSDSPPKLVFTSSIAVFGTPLPALIDDSTPIEPTLSYGAQKRMMELLLADYARRGHIDTRTVRLPGVIARPLQPQKPLSAFSSDIMQELAAGRPYSCPVSPQASNWLISQSCCIAQLIHAAFSPAEDWPACRVVTLPAQRVTTAELITALENLLGRSLAHLVQWAPQPAIEAQFASWPILHTDAADRLGFSHDGTPELLVERALAAAANPSPTHPTPIDLGDKNA